MIKKMNNKGFTLIELLATIAILAILATVTIVTIISSYEKSQTTAEEVFVKQIENYIDDYITMYGSSLEYNQEINGETKRKCYKNSIGTDICNEVILTKASTNPTIKEIEDLFSNKKLINPNTEIPCADKYGNNNVEIEIFKDTDFVYCFTLKKVSGKTSCIKENVNTCANLYK